MYSLDISAVPLTAAEKSCFHDHLLDLGLDDDIWIVYEKFLQLESEYSKPLIIRVEKNDEMFACLFLIACKDYGPTLSKFQIVKYIALMLAIPVHIWMKAGISAENFANPLFINKSVGNIHEINEILNLLREKFILLFIHDLASNATFHPTSAVLPYPDESIIDTTGYATVDDYLAVHRNLKKKLKEYQKIGGKVDIIAGRLDEHLVKKVKESVALTGEKSIFKLPYQNDYPDICAGSATIDNQHIIHFLCRSNNEFYGYHSFIEFRNQMRCLNGAFNRNLATTHHAYENMIYKVVAYAIEKNIDTIYFGPTLNETKKRMMNSFLPTSLYVSSRIPLLLKLIFPFLKRSRLNARELLKFSGISIESA